MSKALRDVQTERQRQDTLWGGPEHDDKEKQNDWVAYMAHYLGRVADFRPRPGGERRQDLIKLAALAVAAAEALDRKGGSFE